MPSIARSLLLSTLLFAACEPLGPSSNDELDVARTASGLTAVTSFGSNPGRLKMFFSTPAGLPAGRPLVVVLHGCGDTAANFSSAWSEWTTLSTQHAFALLFPEQQPENNLGGVSCFNWFDSVNQTRNDGENLSIRQMVEEMERRFSTARARTFVVGFSAGGAEVVNLLATQPDVFAAGVAAAAVPFTCATSVFSAQTCMNGSVDETPTQWAQDVRDAFPAFSGTYPKIAIWHGLNDGTVDPANRLELVEQWTALHGIDTTADETGPGVANDTRRAYKDAQGTTWVELHEVTGTGHELRIGWAPNMAQFLGLTDTVAPVDAGTPPPADAGVRADSGVQTDGGVQADSGSTTTNPDATVTPGEDAGSVGAPDAAQTEADAGGSTPDPTGTRDEGGCTSTSVPSGSSGLCVALLGLALLSLHRRR